MRRQYNHTLLHFLSLRTISKQNKKKKTIVVKEQMHLKSSTDTVGMNFVMITGGFAASPEHHCSLGSGRLVTRPQILESETDKINASNVFASKFVRKSIFYFVIFSTVSIHPFTQF